MFDFFFLNSFTVLDYNKIYKKKIFKNNRKQWKFQIKILKNNEIKFICLHQKPKLHSFYMLNCKYHLHIHSVIGCHRYERIKIIKNIKIKIKTLHVICVTHYK